MQMRHFKVNFIIVVVKKGENRFCCFVGRKSRTKFIKKKTIFDNLICPLKAAQLCLRSCVICHRKGRERNLLILK
jgi:hypothetical protein